MLRPSEIPWRLPYVVELPPPSSRWHKPARWARGGAYFLLAGALTTVCVQLHVQTGRNLSAGRRADREYALAAAAYEQAVVEGQLPAGGSPESAAGAFARFGMSALRVQSAARRVADQKRHKGAIARWCKAVEPFWSGQDIYRPVTGAGAGDPLTGEPLAGTPAPPEAPPPLGATAAEIAAPEVWLHPNMPFVVICLTPLARLSPQAAAAAVNVLKILALLAAILATAAVANHARHRMGEWVVGLGILFCLPMVLSDFQHYNTNVFVLALLAGHLWLYRRGRDAGAGVLLALAICLKMTPALFGLYWLYQRNWRLAGSTLLALAIMAGLIPLLALGPARFEQLTGSWLANLILPGLIKGSPYPTHINQSLSGVFTRLLMHANIYFNPDDAAVAEKFGYINVASLSPAAARFILLGLKAGIVALGAWAIGRRVLPRDDARRSLHYALVAAGMLILNQRTWDHHAAILLIAYLPLWYAIAYGLFGRRRRAACLGGLILTGLLAWGMSKSLYPEELADRIEAYGPTLAQFALVLALCVVLLRTLARAERLRGQPYARERQTLRAPPPRL